mgnify:CR=1 FL=1
MGQDLNLYALCLGLLQPWRSIVNHTEALRESWLIQVRKKSVQTSPYLILNSSHWMPISLKYAYGNYMVVGVNWR